MLRMFRKMIDQSVKRYLDSLPEEKLIKIAEKIAGAEELTKDSIKKMIEAVSGDRVITIYFKGGDWATISNRGEATNKGPGW